MIFLPLLEAVVRERKREACCGGAPCCAEWCRIECPKP